MNNLPVVLWIQPVIADRGGQERDHFSADLMGSPPIAEAVHRKMCSLGYTEFAVYIDSIAPSGLGKTPEEFHADALKRGEEFARSRGLACFSSRRASVLPAGASQAYAELCRSIMAGARAVSFESFLLVSPRALLFTEADFRALASSLAPPEVLLTHFLDQHPCEEGAVIGVKAEFYRIGAESGIAPTRGVTTVSRPEAPTIDREIPFRYRGDYVDVIDELVALPSASPSDIERLWKERRQLFFGVPRHIGVELTNEDNLDQRLRSPRRISVRPPGRMSDENIERLIANFPVRPGVPHSVDLYDFGEPLLHPRALEVIERLVERGVRVDLYTNGILLEEDVAQRLMNAGADAIFVRIDAITPETYGRICGRPDLFARAWENLEALVREQTRRRERGVASPQIVVQITEMPESSQDVGKFLDQFESANAVRERLSKELGRAPDVEDVKKAVPDKILVDHVMIRHDNLYRGKVVREDGVDFSPLYRFPCRQLLAGLHVLYDGSIVPCREDVDCEHVVGSLESGILAAWRGAATRKLLETHLSKKWGESLLCAPCKEWYYSHA